MKGHLKNLNARRIQVLLKSKTMLGKGEKRMEKLKIVFLHNALKWVSSDFYQTSVAFAGIFLTSISSQCCGMASYFGAWLRLCSWEHLFQAGFMVCSEFLGLHSSKVMPPLARHNWSHPVPLSCFRELFSVFHSHSGPLSQALGAGGGGREAFGILCGLRASGPGHVPRSLSAMQAESGVCSSSLTWTGITVLPLIVSVLLTNLYGSLYTSGKRLLGSLEFALKHLT